MRFPKRFVACLLAAFCGSLSYSAAADGERAGGDSASRGLLVGRLKGDTFYERARSALTLYENSDNPWAQSVALMAQLQVQYAEGSGGGGSFGTAERPKSVRWGGVEVRRFRLGMRARLFENLTLFNLTDLEPDLAEGFYQRFPELYLTWSRGDAFSVSAGKCELKFNREQEFASTRFPAFERTAVGNMLYGGELTGVWVKGEKISDRWGYFFGAYSNDRQDEWSRFGGAGSIFVSKVSYSYKEATRLDMAQLKVEWMHNTKPGYSNSTSNPSSPLYSDSLSFSNEIKKGRLGLITELLMADGSMGRSDVMALSNMTTWKFSEKLELISVLEVAKSRDENGVLLPARYEALAPGVGDRRGVFWTSGYTGFTYHVDGHAVKLMGGVKYSDMEGGVGGGDFSGWTWLAGVRLFF